MTDDLATHLTKLERRLQEASVRRNGSELAELISGEFREFGASGRIWNRAEIIAALEAETPGQITSGNFECLCLSSELALLTYVSTNSDRTTLRSSIWRLEQNNWRLLFHQGTIVPPA